MEENQKLSVIVRVIVVALLLAAIPEGWPYGYYVFLRWVVAAVSVLLVVLARSAEKTGWVVVFALVAILFNPIVPIHLDKETWVVLDLAAAALFAASFFSRFETS